MLGEAIILPSLIISIAYQECWEYVVMNGDKIGIISQKKSSNKNDQYSQWHSSIFRLQFLFGTKT